MAKLVVTEFITLDGVMQDPGGADEFERGGWAFRFARGDDGDRFKFDELMAADAQLLGRVTYEGFAKAWPTMEAGEFGVKMNAMPKYVVSSTLERADWNNTTVLRGDLEDEVARLKQRYTGDILVVGSGRLARDLLAKGLVDELHLMVFPVVLGAGQKLFGESPAETGMELVETRQAASVAILTLRPKPSG